MKFSIRRKGTVKSAVKNRAAKVAVPHASDKIEKPTYTRATPTQPNPKPGKAGIKPHANTRRPSGGGLRRASKVVFVCGAEHDGTVITSHEFATELETEVDMPLIIEDATKQLKQKASEAKPARIMITENNLVIEFPSKEQVRHPLKDVLAADVQQRMRMTTPPSSVLQLVYREGDLIMAKSLNVFTKDLPNVCKLVQPETHKLNERMFTRRQTVKLSHADPDPTTAC